MHANLVFYSCVCVCVCGRVQHGTEEVTSEEEEEEEMGEVRVFLQSETDDFSLGCWYRRRNEIGNSSRNL